MFQIYKIYLNNLYIVYIIALGKKINVLLESEGKGAKGYTNLKDITLPWTTSLCLGSFSMNVAIVNSISFATIWSLENLSMQCLEIIYRID